MKSILFVAAALMIGASIYGFVDYSKTSRQKQFKSMYDEKEIKVPVTQDERQPEVKQPDFVSKKEVAETEQQQPAKPVVKKKKKKRSVVVESFSRAPLREREEVVILDPKEVKAKD